MIITNITWNRMCGCWFPNISGHYFRVSSKQRSDFFSSPCIRPRFILEKRPPRTCHFRGLRKETDYRSVDFSPADCFLGAKYGFHSIKPHLVSEEDRVGRILTKLSMTTDKCPRRAGYKRRTKGSLKGRERAWKWEFFWDKISVPSFSQPHPCQAQVNKECWPSLFSPRLWDFSA